MPQGGRLGGVGGVNQCGIGGPPAHVAAAFVEVAVDEVDGVERQVAQAAVGGFLGEPVGQHVEFAGDAGGSVFDALCGAFGGGREFGQLLGHHGKPAPGFACPSGFHAGVHRQDVDGAVDALDLVERGHHFFQHALRQADHGLGVFFGRHLLGCGGGFHGGGLVRAGNGFECSQCHGQLLAPSM